jgi:hypothetical protein
MRLLVLLSIVIATASGCTRIELEYPDGFMYGCTTPDGGTIPPDMLTPAPKCAAAKGLAGDNLLCVDFKDVQMPSGLTGWNFNCMQVADSWISSGGKLQINNFSTFMSTCSFTLPAVSAADYQKYSSFTLSVVHKLDVNSLQQKALIMLGADDDQQRLLDWMTGKQPRKQWTQTVAKADLPLMAMGGFQPLFKITSSVGPGGGYSGWQIESIAIHGIP